MTVKAAGITDEQVIEYTWADDKVSWTLVSAGPTQGTGRQLHTDAGGRGDQGALRHGHRPVCAAARFHPEAHVMGGMETATDGLRKQVLKVKKLG
jgi:hypothetical protein